MNMNRIILFIIITIFSFGSSRAEDVKVVIPTLTESNYALYQVQTGKFLRLDTRNGTIITIEPSNPNKNRILNSEPLTTDFKVGRFQLYPTDIYWKWLLFDSTTGDMWLLKWSDKKDILTKIEILH